MLEQACTLGCNCVQIFAANPRGWTGSAVTRESGAEYQRLAPEYGVRALVVHAIYLVNLASPKPDVAARSLAAMRRDLLAAQQLGALAVVMHPGSDLGDGQGPERLTRALKRLLPEIPSGCRLLLEGMAGRPGTLGHLSVLGPLVRTFPEAIGICLDSAHLCAAGYNFAKATDFSRFDRDVRTWVGYDRVGCLHLNDSRQPCGSHRDNHENLGEGFVGRAGLTRVLAHPTFRHVPVIMETPGFDELGPDALNMQRLRTYSGIKPAKAIKSVRST